MFADQELNMQLAENNGFAITLDSKEMTEESLLNALNEVVNDPK